MIGGDHRASKFREQMNSPQTTRQSPREYEYTQESAPRLWVNDSKDSRISQWLACLGFVAGIPLETK